MNDFNASFNPHVESFEQRHNLFNLTGLLFVL